jgi:hypothetical protein
VSSYKILTPFQLHPERDIETLLELPHSVISESLSSASDPLAAGPSLKTFPILRHPTPHLPSTLVSDGPSPESVNQESEVDPEEEEQDLSHVELADHLNKLFIEDKRFFGQARYAYINSMSCHFHPLNEHSSSYMFAHYTMHAKMEASGTCTPYPLDSKMLRRPLYWELRPVRLHIVGIVVC